MRSFDPWARRAALAVLAAFVVTACSSAATPAPAQPTPTGTAGAQPTGTVEATPTPEPTPTPTPTPEPTPAPTPEPTPTPAPPALVGLLDGKTCTGKWTNETFGSTGDFEMGFDLDASGGTVSLALGGNVFGSAGGRLRIPVTFEGETMHATGDFGYLGTVTASVGPDGSFEIMLDTPPALGPGSKVTATKLGLEGDLFTMTVRIEVGGALLATSRVEATCS